MQEQQQQRAIIEVRWGPQRGKKAAIEPGKSLRVGRVERADLVIAGDAQMSGLHFELDWDGALFRVKDLGSVKGTLVRGEPVSEGELASGDWIRAGETDFMVYIEAATPPPDADADADEADPDAPDALFQQELAARKAEERAYSVGVAAERLGQVSGSLYAVIDAARDPRSLVLVRESVEHYQSLYEGLEAEGLADVAPYLVQLSEPSGLVRRLLDEGWGRRWCIFLDCPQPFREVRRHLRRFLMVEEEDTRKKLYFRFYDPVVLRTVLPTFTRFQQDELHGPIRAFFLEGEDLDILRFARRGELPC